MFSFTWKPYQVFIDKNSSQLKIIKKIINQEPITYCIDEDDTSFEGSSIIFSKVKYGVVEQDKSYNTIEPELFFQNWFKNVLKRGNRYPKFEEVFADIIPILKNNKKMKKISCGPNPKEYSFEKLKTSNKNFQPGSETEDLRIVFSSKDLLVEALQKLTEFEDGSGFYVTLSDRKLIWAPKVGSNIEKFVLIHEFGHMLGLADISHDTDKQAKEYGSSSEKSIMADGYLSLSCDDADALVSMLYLAMEKDKIFRSFCNPNVFYDNGKMISQENAFVKTLQTLDWEQMFKLYHMPTVINF